MAHDLITITERRARNKKTVWRVNRCGVCRWFEDKRKAWAWAEAGYRRGMQWRPNCLPPRR